MTLSVALPGHATVASPATSAALPAVSVIMPTYNRDAYIGEAIASLRSEQAVAIEIIVVDDGSTDATLPMLRTLAAEDNRIRVIEAAHGGVSKARNIGVQAARGEYIAFLDSDDVNAPGRLARQAGKLNTRPDIWVVTGHTRWFTQMTADLQPAPGTIWFRMAGWCLCNAMFRRSIFSEFGLFDETLRFGEDADLYLRLFEVEAPILLEVEIATYYRMHRSNMTRDQSGAYRGLLQAYHKSIERRRRAGRMHQPVITFINRSFDEEKLYGVARLPGGDAIARAGTP